jgi:hypothetical protein
MWVLTKAKDFKRLLQAIGDTFPNAVLYLEGSPVGRVKTVLDSLPPSNFRRHLAQGTIWPKQQQYHLLISSGTIELIASLADHNAVPEIASHLVVYDEKEILLEAYDVTSSEIDLAHSIEESVVKKISEALSASYTREEGELFVDDD